jgi:hypothetical protein
MSRLRPVAALLAACRLLAGCGVVPGLGEADLGGERGIGAGFAEPEVVAGEPAAVLAGAYGRLRHVGVASDGALWG